MSYVSALEISPRVIAAIKQLLRDRHWYAIDLAETLEVSPASISKWMHSRTATIRPDIAQRLLPMLEPYLETLSIESSGKDGNFENSQLSEKAEILALIYDTLSVEAQSRIEKFIRAEEARELRHRIFSR